MAKREGGAQGGAFMWRIRNKIKTVVSEEANGGCLLCPSTPLANTGMPLYDGIKPVTNSFDSSFVVTQYVVSLNERHV